MKVGVKRFICKTNNYLVSNSVLDGKMNKIWSMVLKSTLSSREEDYIYLINISVCIYKGAQINGN